MNLQELLKKCHEENRAAQHILYNMFYNDVFNIALRYSKNETDAKDIIQESFIKIFLNLKYYKGQGSFQGWVKKIAKNTSLAHCLNLKKYMLSDDMTTVSDKSHACFQTAPEQSFADLKTVLSQLPEGYRTVINLYIDGYSHKEIANLLNISEGTSKSQVFHARKSLKVLFA